MHTIHIYPFLSLSLFFSLSLSQYIYIYIYIERERGRETETETETGRETETDRHTDRDKIEEFLKVKYSKKKKKETLYENKNIKRNIFNDQENGDTDSILLILLTELELFLVSHYYEPLICNFVAAFFKFTDSSAKLPLKKFFFKFLINSIHGLEWFDGLNSEIWMKKN